MFFVFLKLIFCLPYLIFAHARDLKAAGVHLYGIYGFFGLPGQGKTMAMSRYLKNMRKKYGNKIYIMTNYFYKDQDFAFNSWKDLLKDYDKPLIVAWDEVQNEFNSRDFKSFPISLLTLLTQVRKKNGIQLLYTSQRWHFVDKNFRSLSFGCYECKTLFGNLTITKKYDPVDYDCLCEQNNFEKRKHIRPIMTHSFIQRRSDRECYDSYKMLESAKSKEYMERGELPN